MTPDLLALLSKEQQEAWKHYELSAWPQLPHGYPAALLELAQVKAALEELRAAVDDADCATFCQSNMGPGEYGFAAYQEYLNTNPKQPDKRYDCDCWKSRLPK